MKPTQQMIDALVAAHKGVSVRNRSTSFLEEVFRGAIESVAGEQFELTQPAKINLNHAGVARRLKAAEYRGEPCDLDPFEVEAVVDMLKDLETLKAVVVAFEPCECGEGCCVDPVECSSPLRLRALVAGMIDTTKPADS